MRNFASTLVKFSKLSHIQTTIWRPSKMAGSAGPFVTPLVELSFKPTTIINTFYSCLFLFRNVTVDSAKSKDSGFETTIQDKAKVANSSADQKKRELNDSDAQVFDYLYTV